MISININGNLYEDEWGFYVDIEKQNTVTFDNYKIMREKDSIKNPGSSSKNSDINWEYDCYLNNKRNNLFNNSEKKENIAQKANEYKREIQKLYPNIQKNIEKQIKTIRKNIKKNVEKSTKNAKQITQNYA